MHQKLKLSHRRHTGKRLPHRHSSFGVLLALLLVPGSLMLASDRIVLADGSTIAGSIGINGLVKGPPPSQAAVILKPVNGQVFHAPGTTVSGTCPDGVNVQVFKNKVFAGSTACANGAFSLAINLLRGENKLVAKVIDNIGQYGPDSKPVIVSYRPMASVPGSPSEAEQFVITTDKAYQAGDGGEPFNISLLVLGGQAPYALSVDWGDGHSDVLTDSRAGAFQTPHTYRYGGSYQVTVRGSDNRGGKAALDLVVIINGSPKPLPVAGSSELQQPYVPPSYQFIWPLYLLLLVVISTF